MSTPFDNTAVDFLEMLIKLSDIDKLRSQNNGELMSAQDEMNRLIEYITMNQRRLVSNQELADHIFRSKNYVIKRFCTEFGVTPYEYQIQQKIFSARNLLENTKLSVKEITDLIGYGDQHYFSAMFKKETGESFVAYLTDHRMERASRLLIETNEKSYMIARQVGYTDPNYFSYVFKRRFGVSPSKYRTEHADSGR